MEADNNADRADAAEAKVKKLELELMHKDQEIQSLQHKLGVLEGDLEKSEGRLAAAKLESADSTSTKSTAEGMARKIQLLEDELDTAEKNVKETMEKYVYSNLHPSHIYWCHARLRQVDVKAEHFERQVSRVEQERDQWEKKYEVCFRSNKNLSLLTSLQDANGKYQKTQKELDELVRSMEGI